MLGIALSVGASGALVSQTEASATVSAPAVSDATKAFSSDSKASQSQAAEAKVDQVEIVAYHTVESGESLWQIAQQHRIGLRELKVANRLPPETSIRVGQVLKVPGNSEVLPGALSLEITESSSPSEMVALESASELSDSAPNLMNQSIEQTATADEVGTAEISVLTTAEVDSSEVLNQSATLEIEIADAEIADASMQADTSVQAERVETEPVVTAALAVPQSFSSYKIQAGDTLASIASSLGTTTQEIINANGLANPDFIVTGATLRVPENSGQIARRSSFPSEMTGEANAIGGPRPASERLAYLQSTATRPDAARLLGEMRSATPEQPYSVGNTTQSVDPYIASLLDEVESVREAEIDVSEVTATTEIDGVSERRRLLSRSEQRRADEQLSEQIVIAPENTAADPELLAAAPLSPDAYIPAQRPTAGQVVSPDMPLLPDSGEFLPDAPEVFDGYIWPTRGTFTSGYGWRWGRMHRGIDVAGPVGTPVVAAAMGVVEQAGWNSGGYGNLVEIRHPDGSMTLYAHNNSISVRAGQTVRQGQKIAEMGSTGYSTGPHLHFEIHLSGQGAVNPVAHLPRR